MQLTKAQLAYIKDNQSECPRGIAKYLGVKLSAVKAWLKLYAPKARRLINKSKKQKRMPSVSKKMVGRLALYKSAHHEHLASVKQCEVCGNEYGLSIHHIAGRSGQLLYDRSNFLVVCMAGSTYLNEQYPDSNLTEGCHPWIERNLSLSRELGYSKSKIHK